MKQKKSEPREPIRSKNDKKETITLSIDKFALDDIRNEAAKEGKSINSFINSILLDWTSVYKHWRENSAVVLTAKNFQAHLQHIDEEVIINELKDNTLNLIPAMLAERNIALTLENLIEHNYKAFGVAGGALQSVQSFTDEEGRIAILFRHQHGIKWSRILAKAFSAELETLFDYHTLAEISPYMVKLKILEKIQTSSPQPPKDANLK